MKFHPRSPIQDRIDFAEFSSTTPKLYMNPASVKVKAAVGSFMERLYPANGATRVVESHWVARTEFVLLHSSW